jgi:hypothetical protein
MRPLRPWFRLHSVMAFIAGLAVLLGVYRGLCHFAFRCSAPSGPDVGHALACLRDGTR